MKKLLLLILLFIGLSLQAQVELKGIKLGIKNNSKQTVTTVGTVKGVIIIETLNNGICYRIVFFPSKNGIYYSNIYNYDVKKLIKGIENNYHIILVKKEDSYFAIKDSIRYTVLVKDNRFVTPGYYFRFIITDVKLSAIARKELQEVVNKDF